MLLCQLQPPEATILSVQFQQKRGRMAHQYEFDENSIHLPVQQSPVMYDAVVD
jgi:hypothetical protein